MPSVGARQKEKGESKRICNGEASNDMNAKAKTQGIATAVPSDSRAKCRDENTTF